MKAPKRKKDGTFAEGHGGRPTGARNKVPQHVRAALGAVLIGHIDRLPEYLEELTGKERIDVLAKLLPYIAPRLQAIEWREVPEVVELLEMPEAERKARIAELKKQVHG